ncbi:MAG: hypothetical protein V4487_05630 [Chlamydiota bacterium]
MSIISGFRPVQIGNMHCGHLSEGGVLAGMELKNRMVVMFGEGSQKINKPEIDFSSFLRLIEIAQSCGSAPKELRCEVCVRKGTANYGEMTQEGLLRFISVIERCINYKKTHQNKNK